MNKNFEKYLNFFIKNEKFKKSKKNRTWYKYDIKNDTYFILNLEKSRFSDNFYVYIGFNYSNIPIKDDWNINVPDIYSCNVSCSLDALDIKRKLIFLNGIPNDTDITTCKKIFEFILLIYKNNKTQYDFIKNYNHKGYELEDYAKWIKENDEN